MYRTPQMDGSWQEKIDDYWDVGDDDEDEDDTEKAIRKVTTDDVTPDDNYKCTQCGEEQHIEDHQRKTPAWCGSCDKITDFERMEENDG